MKTFKEFIYEMAFDKNKAEERITGLGGPIVLHLIKVVRYSDALNNRKHVMDIQNWLMQVSLVSLKKNKKITADEYFKWLFMDQKLSLRLIKGVHVNYDQLPYNSNMEVDQAVLDKVIEIGKHIAQDLANDSVIDIKKYL